MAKIKLFPNKSFASQFEQTLDSMCGVGQRPETSGAPAKGKGSAGTESGDGGAGNRTLVRMSLQNRVYVRRLNFLPSRPVGVEPTSRPPIS